MKETNIVLKEMSAEEFEQSMEEGEGGSIISRLVAALADADKKETDVLLQAINEVLDKTEENSRAFALYDGDTYVGYIALADYDSATPEIQIELIEAYRRRGIGYLAMQSVMSAVFQREDVAFLIYRCHIDNVPSIALAEKCGGVWVKYDSPLDRIIRCYHIHRPEK